MALYNFGEIKAADTGQTIWLFAGRFIWELNVGLCMFDLVKA